MTLLWFDGFETYENYQDMNRLQIYSSGDQAFLGPYTATGGRRSTRAPTFDNHTYRIPFSLQNTLSENSTIIIGFAVRDYSAGNFVYQNSYPFLRFYDAYAGNTHISVTCDAGSRKFDIRNSAQTVLGTTTYALPFDTWVYMEVKVYIHNTAGTVEIRFNGSDTADVALTSQDTLNGSNAYVGYILKWGITDWHYSRIDDLYICNGQGSVNNDFLGDIRVDIVRPNEAGAHTDFTPSTGSNYQNVDETYPDDDTTYNQSNDTAAGEQDSYGMESLEILGSTIHGVKDQITIRKSDAGTREVKLITRQSGTDYLGSTITLSDSYTTNTRVMEVNPSDSAAFQETDVNSGEVGVEVVT